jgi:mRNA-degrading endonuclease toxin of MazEF toxin-antitoxin module
VVRRGDVVELKVPAMGFAREPRRDLALVLQTDPANQILATTVVAPVDDQFSLRSLHAFDIVIPASEAGTADDRVAHLDLLQRVQTIHLGPRTGAARSQTMAQVTAKLRLLLG